MQNLILSISVSKSVEYFVSELFQGLCHKKKLLDSLDFPSAALTIVYMILQLHYFWEKSSPQMYPISTDLECLNGQIYYFLTNHREMHYLVYNAKLTFESREYQSFILRCKMMKSSKFCSTESSNLKMVKKAFRTVTVYTQCVEYPNHCTGVNCTLDILYRVFFGQHSNTADLNIPMQQELKKI